MPVQLPGVVLDTSVLDKMTAELEPKAAETIKKYGYVIAGDAAQMAPYDTGALHDTILAESKMTDKLTYTVQDGVEYGVYQELGTHKMAAHPFLVPAVEKWANKFLDAMFKLIGGNTSSAAGIFGDDE